MSDKKDPKEEENRRSFERATRSTMRALSGNRKLQVSHFGTQGRLSGDSSAVLPETPKELSNEARDVARGISDSLALKARHHNAAMFRAREPMNTAAREAFNALEQLRSDALGAREYAGVSKNLEAAIAARGEQFRKSYVSTTQKKALAIQMLAWDALTGQNTAGKWKADIAELREWFDHPKGLKSYLDRMNQVLHDQDEFAKLMRQMLSDLELEDYVPDPEPEIENLQPDPDGEDSPPDNDEGEDSADVQVQGQQKVKDKDQGSEDEQKKSAKPEQGEISATDMEDMDAGEEVEDDSIVEDDGTSELPVKRPSVDDRPSKMGYKIFTTKHDEIVRPQDLVSLSELRSLRDILDQNLKDMRHVVARLAHKLQRLLLAQQNTSWSFDEEEGILDTARLSRVVVNPMASLSFKQEHASEFKDTVVTILIDNSGSMRGRPIITAACCADILSQTFERCGIKCEVLGYTTKAWKGGKSREDWFEAKKPNNPGRLNDIRHIIYKPADMPYRRSRDNMGLMLREGILKENIDGEALLWAQDRLLARPEKRKIMMVISDGAPVDDSTLVSNPASFLEQHLREVITSIESKRQIELMAIGIGHDVTRYYKHATHIHSVETLPKTMIAELTKLFDIKAKRRRSRGLEP